MSAVCLTICSTCSTTGRVDLTDRVEIIERGSGADRTHRLIRPTYRELFDRHFPRPLPRRDTMPVLHPSSAREAGMDSAFLFHAIDSIVRKAIEMHAFPGCQLFVARDGKVVIDKSYGYHDYSKAVPVAVDHLYDLASITKMAATTLAMMKLAEEHHVSLDDRLSKHYAPLRTADKRSITIREMMAHRSGLPAGIPSPWLMTRQRLIDTIPTLPLRSKIYRYSDLPFILFPEVVRLVCGVDFETFLYDRFYMPLGVGLVFNPQEHRIPLEKIVPTETDDYRRGTKDNPLVVHGTVHDESAATMGGVSGNAGLFGTARDLAVVMQMLLNGGIYDGKRYLRASTIKEFTRRQYLIGDNRRALGFDKPTPGNDTLPFEEAYPAPGASPSSFGHTGFTGTIAWADPENGVVYVLLCNRITPSRNNRAFIDSRVRYSLQQTVYDAIRRFDETGM